VSALRSALDAIAEITTSKRRMIMHCVVTLDEFREIIRCRGDGAEVSRCPDTGQISIDSVPVLIAERMTGRDVPADSYVSPAACAIFAQEPKP
jgi:hypothetical protein